MKKGILKLTQNRVRRNYRGGAGIDALQGRTNCQDSDRPEEWVGSMVEASNPGMEQIPCEGLSVIETEHGKEYLRDIVESEKEYYLGKSIHKDGTWQLSFLLKILDSSMRLHVQAHPTTQFAKEVMGKPYGKLECYYILSARENVDPYIRLGFQHAPTKAEWKEIIEQQDMSRMDSCFEKIPVKPGEVWYIPGGMPHAIGEGIMMLEIMEPSDLVVRCEFEREGIVVPEGGRFMGKGIDFCLDIFDYTEYSKENIQEKCRIKPELLEQTDTFLRQRLIGEELTPCFFVEKMNVYREALVAHNHKFTLGVVCSGSCTIESIDEKVSLNAGDSFMIAAATEEYRIVSDGDVEFVIVYPGKDMES